MSDIKIIDDFLDVQDYNQLYKEISSASFPWYYNKQIVDFAIDDKDIKRLQFTHKFYENHMPNSNFINIINPLINKINPKALIKIKANLGLIDSDHIHGGFHTDYNFDCRTAVYYLNTNNGYTEFENGQIIESISNRFVSFNSKIKHSGVSQTDTQERIVININYFD